MKNCLKYKLFILLIFLIIFFLKNTAAQNNDLKNLQQKVLDLSADKKIFFKPQWLWEEKNFSGEKKIEDYVLQLTNEERAKQKLPLLVYDKSLMLAARQHSKEMIDLNYFAHESPKSEWELPYLRAYYAGFYEAFVGENIAENFGNSDLEVAKNLITAWMNSPGHRANILKKDYTHLGVGVVKANNQYFATQLFAEKYFNYQNISLTIKQEKSYRYKVVIAHNNKKVALWINDNFSEELPSYNGIVSLQQDFPKNSGKYKIQLTFDNLICYTVYLNTDLPFGSGVISSKNIYEKIKLLQDDLKEITITNLLLEGTVTPLIDITQVGIYLDEKNLQTFAANKGESFNFKVRIPLNTNKHKIGIYPNNIVKYQWFIDSNQSLENAFIPRFYKF